MRPSYLDDELFEDEILDDADDPFIDEDYYDDDADDPFNEIFDDPLFDLP